MHDKKLWFKAKRYGYGWYPCTWQGWVVILLYLIGLFSASYSIELSEPNISRGLMFFFPQMFVLTIFLMLISSAKGEKARWRWGNKPIEHENNSVKEQNTQNNNASKD